MPELDNQLTYWDTTGATKTFTHPIDFTWLRDLAPTARILDFGCGYGRVARLALDAGFPDVEGVDTSPALIERARQNLPDLTFHTLADPTHLPYPDASIDAVLRCGPHLHPHRRRSAADHHRAHPRAPARCSAY